MLRLSWERLGRQSSFHLNSDYRIDRLRQRVCECRVISEADKQCNGLCGRTHHIRVDAITDIVTQNLSNIVRFASQFEDEFVKIVMDEQYKQVIIQQRKNQTALQEAVAREKEVDLLYERLFEEKILGNLTEERFKKLSYKYEDEQTALKQKVKHLKEIVENEKAHEMNADGFLQIVRKYTDITELTTEILHEFIDKIVVHHREQVHGETIQKVEIYYKMIGYVELPQMSKAEQKSLQAAFGRTETAKQKTDRSA